MRIKTLIGYLRAASQCVGILDSIVEPFIYRCKISALDVYYIRYIFCH